MLPLPKVSYTANTVHFWVPTPDLAAVRVTKDEKTQPLPLRI